MSHIREFDTSSNHLSKGYMVEYQSEKLNLSSIYIHIYGCTQLIDKTFVCVYMYIYIKFIFVNIYIFNFLLITEAV